MTTNSSWRKQNLFRNLSSNFIFFFAQTRCKVFQNIKTVFTSLMMGGKSILADITKDNRFYCSDPETKFASSQSL